MTKRALIAGITGQDGSYLAGLPLWALAWIKRVTCLPDIPVVLSSVSTVAVQRLS